jgi:hypothetical protein
MCNLTGKSDPRGHTLAVDHPEHLRLVHALLQASFDCLHNLQLDQLPKIGVSSETPCIIKI